MNVRKLSWLLTLLAVAAMPLFVVRFPLFNLPTTVLEIAILAAVATTIASHWGSMRSWPTVSQIAGLWVIVGLVSALYAPHALAGLGLWRAYFLEATLLAGCIWLQVDSLQRVRKILATLVGMGTMVGLYAVYQHFTGFGIPQPWQDESVRRVTAWLGYPNAVGLLLAPLVGVAVGVGLNTSAPKHRYTYWVAAAIMTLAVFFAHSEGGLIGIAAGLVAMGLLFSKQTRLITLGLVVAGAIVVTAVAPLRQYAVKTLTLNDCPVLYECSLSLRRAQWVETWDMLSHGRWMYGTGLGGYQQAIAPYHNHPGIEIYLYPHNIFLNFWAETGLLGLTIFLVLVGSFWYQISQTLGTKHRSLVIAAAGAMVTLLVHGLVDVPYFKNDLSVLFWLIMLVPFLVQKIDAEAEKN